MSAILFPAMSHAHNLYATYLHAHAQQLTLHSVCGVSAYGEDERNIDSAERMWGMCSVEL